MTIALTSREVLGQFINLREDDDRYDQLLEYFVIQASELIEEYLGRGLEKKERTEFHQSKDSQPGDPIPQHLWLDSFPLDLDEQFTVQYSNELNWDTQINLASDKYCQVDPDKGIVRIFTPLRSSINPEVFTDHMMGFKITYTGGYPVTNATGAWIRLNVPSGLSTAAAMQAAFLFNSHSRGSIGLGTTGGDQSGAAKTKPTSSEERQALIPEVRTALRPYLRKGSLIGRKT